MRYTGAQKAEALKLADEIGARRASERLSIAYPTILDWRKKREKASILAGLVRRMPSAPKEAVAGVEDPTLEAQVQLLQQENALLRTQLARQTKAIHALSPVADKK